ncbi:hypothetical protein Cpin_3080 [Chitinophaga pinensis DSM 2588]|uniref:Uncharacterized protein n=1 Tax=Chitinophaga pinensis (strain ATCC 43595 / DSM 2588 / LMG 13176 / NBRC 15968 / NCIMB 11800 / UQM 2034) TaxID=485918 RepID=A0A979G4C3_CHIPD|nr:hypothetical protein Cpin_3080 [Chitinophaga pinensis DSM 2588]
MLLSDCYKLKEVNKNSLLQIVCKRRSKQRDKSNENNSFTYIITSSSIDIILITR